MYYIKLLLLDIIALVKDFDTDLAFEYNVELVSRVSLVENHTFLLTELVGETFSDVDIVFIRNLPFLKELDLLNDGDQLLVLNHGAFLRCLR